jgi:pSer/pThr/pTyr-binding forkhead associated (FHA) protein
MIVRLVVDQGGKRTVMKLRPPAAVLGRARGNTVRIPSADVSRRHCRLLLKDGLVTVEDLDSANGTFLNGRRIKSPEYVHPGDAIEVGPVTFVVEYELTPEAHRLLRGGGADEEPADALEALADGELLEAEATASDDEDLPLLEAMDDDAPEISEGELLDVESEGELPDVEPVSAEEADSLAPVDFDIEETPWQMPEGSELRELLSGMEDDEPPAKRHNPRR